VGFKSGMFYCADCVYLQEGYADDEAVCTAPENTEVNPNHWRSPQIRRKRSPRVINKTNSCQFFRAQCPHCGFGKPGVGHLTWCRDFGIVT
jgi:hypothetical protein